MLTDAQTTDRSALLIGARAKWNTTHYLIKTGSVSVYDPAGEAETSIMRTHAAASTVFYNYCQKK